MANRLVWLSFLILVAVPLRVTAEPRQVLLLHSFEREFAPFDVIAQNFRTELSLRSSEAVNFYEVSLQPARSNQNPQEKPILDYVHAMFANRRLDLVVPIGGPAVKFAQKYRQQLFPSTPMLLAASDQRHMDMALVTPNDAIVGVVNDGPLVIENILNVFPQTRTVYVVLGHSQLETFWRNELEDEFQRFKGRLNFVWLNELSFKEILERSAVLPPNSAIFYVLLSVDGKGVSQTEAIALPELHAVANAPIFGFHSSQLGRGVFGGPMMNIDELSRNAAGAALRILDGEAPEHLRLAPQRFGLPMFDWRELRRWNVSTDSLPPGSIVRFRGQTGWERYKWHIIAAASVCLVEALLILALIANLIQRRRVQRSLAESRNRLGAILSTAAEGIITFSEAGIIESVNTAAENIFRYSAAEMIGQSVHTFIPTLFGTECAQGVATFERRHTDQLPNAGREIRGRSKAGSWFPIELTVREVVLADRIIFTGFVRDITERKRAEQMEREFGKQLLQAQEAERARLARELHDDITQRLALLAVHADRADSGKDPAEQRKTVRGIRDSLKGLSEDVHALAYKLHPSLLERLGLVDALQAECERFSQEESIAVDVKLESLQIQIPQEARLCLFRVTQEALRNVARHSCAKSVQVSLRSTDGGLQLTVVDNGAGFDPGQDPQRASLGLASMRERVRLLEGKLDIESRRGHGTTVVGWIPLKSESTEPELRSNVPVAAVSGRGNL